MTIAESRRLALYESVKTFLGEDNALTLMAYLPPDPETVATKADLALLGSELRGEMKDLRNEVLEKLDDRARLLMITMLTTTVTVVLTVLFAAPS